jgi:hypothetical protein
MATRTATYLLGSITGCVQDQDVALVLASASGDSNGLKQTDYRIDDGGLQRTIFGKLTNSGSVNLYVYPFPGDVATKHLETVVSVGSSSFNATTETFSEVLNGPFWAIEAEKADGTGEAVVIAYI